MAILSYPAVAVENIQKTVRDLYPEKIAILDQSSKFPPFTPCWVWTGVRTGGHGKYVGVPGYGRVMRDGMRWSLHRLSYHLKRGCDPALGDVFEGWMICHSCNNPPCCNPDHVLLGTALENAQYRISWQVYVTPVEIAFIRASHLGEEVLAHMFRLARSQVKAIRPRGFQPIYFSKPASYV